MRTTYLILSVPIVLAVLVGNCLAEIVTATGTIESVDLASHTISVRRKTGKGEKTGTFTLSDDAQIITEGGDSDLAALKVGDSVTLSYDTVAKRVTRIELASEKDGETNEVMQKPDNAGGMHAHHDIAYAEPKNQRQMLDVYAPANAKDCPIVFWIHGGGMEGGDKSEMDSKPKAFVDRGFVFVATNYRFLPHVTIRDIARDLAKSIRWVHDHARDYGGDPDKIFVMGHSAGALLSALVCTDERYLKAEGLSFSIIKGCVPVDGDTYDVRMQIAAVEPKTKAVYRRKFGPDGQQRDLSPVTHVVKGNRIPPFLLLCVADHPETGPQALRLARKMNDLGMPASVFAAQGKNHLSINSDLGKPSDGPTQAVFDFLDRSLKSETTSGKN